MSGSAVRKNSGFAAVLIWAFAGGLLGYAFQLHQVFLGNSSEGVAARTAPGFLLAAVVTLGAVLAFRAIATPAVQRLAKSAFEALTTAVLFAALFYMAFILFKNTEFLFRYDGLLSDILGLYPLFAGVSILLALALKFLRRGSLATASLAVFLVAAAFIVSKTRALMGASLALCSFLYLILLGRFVVGALARVIKQDSTDSLTTFLASFTGGIVANYLLWYTLGSLGLLYAATAYGVTGLVCAAGLARYGKSLLRTARGSRALINRNTSFTTAALLNVTLFCALIIVALLTIKFPGNADSSARMYAATVYKFSAMHRIVFPPFYQHWPLIFQPMLHEMTVLPPFLMGGITALRFSNGLSFFSFIPFLVLLCRVYNLSYRTVVLFTLITLASSFSFSLASFDKPSVMALPAMVSLIAISLVMLRDPKPWHFVLVSLLAVIIYNTKLVLMHGVAGSLVLVSIGLLSKQLVGQNRRAIIVAAAIFITVCAVHAGQNTILRGNPWHPFAADIFTSSQAYPEETKFADIPATFYQRTMPTERPSHISTINVDPTKGMYRPNIFGSPDRRGKGYGISKTSVTIVVVLVALVLPFLLMIRRDTITVFCALLASFSFFVWFGWIGDGLRYSSFFPSIALLSAVLASRPLLPNRWLDLGWRYGFYFLLIASIPVGLYFTAGLPTSRPLFNQITTNWPVDRSLKFEPHVVTTYLQAQKEARAVLLVADLEVSQYEFFQPNFLYQPIRWRKDLFTNMVYLSAMRPTHLLTSGPLGKSVLLQHYPFLADFLREEKVFEVPRKPMVLFRFSEQTPWADWHTEFLTKEEYVPGHITDLERTLSRPRQY